MADQAAALLRAGRLHEIVGVRPGATRAEVKKACQSARLRTHPDKQGGDTSLFRIVEDAVQQLLYEGPRFDGPTPGWAAQHIARIQEKQEDVEALQGRLAELQNTLEHCTTERPDVHRHLAVAEALLASYTRELRDLRDAYLECYRLHVQKEEACVARGEYMMEEAHRKMLRASRERDSLRRRTSRTSSSRFPTLPRVVVGAIRLEFNGIRARFRKFSQTRSRYAKDGRDVATIDCELGELLSHARTVADTAVAGRCQARGLHMLFPHLTRKHSKYSSLSTLRLAHRRLCDRISKARKSGVRRDDLEAEDAEIVRQAWVVVAQTSTEAGSV
jgi:DNA repair exonuclease SbcCD ATPase subunit